MKSNMKLYAISGLALVALFFATSMLYKNSQKEELSFLAKESSEVFIRDYSPRYGDKEARVCLVEFLDPECESCRVFYPQIKSLLKEFDGKVQLIVRYAPFHRNSKIAIRALEAARIQGKYWESLAMLFHYQPYWGNHHNPKPKLIFEYLSKLGLNMDKLRSDMQSPQIEKIIEQDQKDLKTLNVRGTPTFFVNGKTPEKFGIEYLRKAIQEGISKMYD